MPRREDGSICYSDTHYRDTWAAMEGLVDKGLVRAIGLSNFNARQTADIMSTAKYKPAVNQVYIKKNTFLESFWLLGFSCFRRENNQGVLLLCRWNVTPTCVRQISSPTAGQWWSRSKKNLHLEPLDASLSDFFPQVSVCLRDGLQSSRKRWPTLGLSGWTEPLTGPSTGDHRSEIPEDSSSGHSQVGQRLTELKAF